MRYAVALLAAAAIWSTAGFAADVDVKPPPEPAAPAASVFAPPDASCVAWTDGCRVCRKPETGETVCSNVGPACIPQAIQCTQRR